MKRSHENPCLSFRDALSARQDGELADERALLGHLVFCGACRDHERALAALAPHWHALRDASLPPDLWARIERSARPRRMRSPLSIGMRAAALLVGYLGVWAVVRALDEPPRRARQPDVPAVTHVPEIPGIPEIIQLFAPETTSTAPTALFASLPEYQLLRHFPSAAENSR